MYYNQCFCLLIKCSKLQQLKARGLLQAFAEAAHWVLHSWLCDDSDMYQVTRLHKGDKV